MDSPLVGRAARARRAAGGARAGGRRPRVPHRHDRRRAGRRQVAPRRRADRDRRRRTRSCSRGAACRTATGSPTGRSSRSCATSTSTQVLGGEPDGETAHERILEAVGRAEPRSRSDELYWAIRRLLETLARERPVVLVLDDIQWAEPAFLDLVEYLAGWSRDAPILVCCMARPDLAELRPAWAGATIQLAPLPRRARAHAAREPGRAARSGGGRRGRSRHRRQSALPRGDAADARRGRRPRRAGRPARAARGRRLAARAGHGAGGARRPARPARRGRARGAAARVGDRTGLLVGCRGRPLAAGARSARSPATSRRSSARG